MPLKALSFPAFPAPADRRFGRPGSGRGPI